MPAVKRQAERTIATHKNMPRPFVFFNVLQFIFVTENLLFDFQTSSKRLRALRGSAGLRDHAARIGGRKERSVVFGAEGVPVPNPFGLRVEN